MKYSTTTSRGAASEAAQPRGRQDADLRDVRDVRDDHQFRGHGDFPEVIREFDLGSDRGGALIHAPRCRASPFRRSRSASSPIAHRPQGHDPARPGHVRGSASALFAAGHEFLFFVSGCWFVSGLGIGIFESGALALIGDLSPLDAGNTPAR